jgi:hypothetical protein
LAPDNAARPFRPRAGLGIFVSSCSEFEKPMFTLLRGVAIIGVIFYFSPARDLGEGHAKGGEERRPAPHATASSEAHEAPWNRLVGSLKEEAVRTAVNEKTLSAGLRLKDNATRLLAGAPAVPAPPERPRSSDAEWALREAFDPSVRCIYRCDGTE